MIAKNEQITQSIVELEQWEASTERYDKLVGIAKEMVKEHGEAELFAVISGDIALLSLFCVQMFDIKEILEIFPNHKVVISEIILKELNTLYKMNINRAKQEVFQFYKSISGNKNLLDHFGIHDEYIHFVEFGNYRFFSLLGNMVKNYPSSSVNICDQLLKCNWFIADKHDGLKYLIRLTGETFIDHPDCINKILDGYIEIIRNIERDSFVVNHFHMDAQKLFKVCLSYPVANNNDECLPNYIKDKTVQLLFKLYDVLAKIEDKQNKYLVEQIKRVRDKIIRDNPRVKSFIEIRSAARLLGQATSFSLFANFPDEVLVKIASHVKNPEVHTEAEADKIAREHLGHYGLQ